MGKIFLVPIEPLEERYSADWLKWFTPFCDVVITAKPLTTTITSGAFLDVCGTNYYKSQQLTTICKMIHDGEVKDGDTFLFLDLWFPGLEMLAYMRDALGIKFKITGCLHAGTYDPFDFLTKKGMVFWGKHLENSWFSLVDQVFVATIFHKDLLITTRNISPSKIKVTGFPITNNEIVQKKAKEKIIVFPHRLDSEKNPDQFDRLAEALKRTHSNWSLVKSKDVCATKQEYYDLLNRSTLAISFADQETWGIAMQEAVFCGNIPIVPNRLSYREMYPEMFRFNSFEMALNSVTYILNFFDKGMGYTFNRELQMLSKRLLDKGLNAIPNIIMEIRNGQ